MHLLEDGVRTTAQLLSASPGVGSGSLRYMLPGIPVHVEVLGMLGSQVAWDLPSQLRQLTPWGKHRFTSHRHLQAELGQSLPLSQLGALWAGKNENYVAVICGVLMGTSTTCSLYMSYFT